MKLRLLPRKEIDVLKAKERQSEINEGAKLAKRVDSLRKLQAEEEAHLSKWRNETLSQIQEEIDSKVKQKQAIDATLTQMQQELETALNSEPLKQAKLFLKKEKERLELGFLEVELQKANLDEVVQMNGALKTLNESELAKRAVERQENERLFLEAERQLREAEQTLASSRDEAKNVRDSAKAIHVQAVKRENDVAQWQRELELKANLLHQKEEELEKRELDVIVRELQFNSPIKHGKRHNTNIS